MAEIINENMIATTIRLPADRMKILKDYTQKYHVSFSEIIRVIVDNRLSKYFGTLRYADYNQGEEIRTRIIDMQNTLNKINRDIARIGVNFNQEVKLRQIEKKYKGVVSFDAAKAIIKEKAEVEAECSKYSQEEFEKTVLEFQIAVAKFGKDLSCIHA